MRTTSIVILALLLAPAGKAWAQAAAPGASAPEMFGATARAGNATAAVSGMLEVRIDRYTPDFDRTAVETALRHGGYSGFLIALRKAPGVGELVLGGGLPYTIRYARQTVGTGGRTIVLVTDKPVLFLGSSRTDARSRAGYEVAVIRIEVDGTGRGSGTMAAAARVRPDGDGGVLLDDYADVPIALTDLTRKPL